MSNDCLQRLDNRGNGIVVFLVCKPEGGLIKDPHLGLLLVVADEGHEGVLAGERLHHAAPVVPQRLVRRLADVQGRGGAVGGAVKEDVVLGNRQPR